MVGRLYQEFPRLLCVSKKSLRSMEPDSSPTRPRHQIQFDMFEVAGFPRTLHSFVCPFQLQSDLFVHSLTINSAFPKRLWWTRWSTMT